MTTTPIVRKKMQPCKIFEISDQIENEEEDLMNTVKDKLGNDNLSTI